MTYRQLQQELKIIRANGTKLNCKLNAKKVILQAEYDRVTAIQAQSTESFCVTKIDMEEVETVAKEINAWSMGLWYGSTEDDMYEAGVNRLFVAYDDDENIVGYQTVSGDGLCVAIETHPQWRGKGVAAAIIDESGCYRPEQNQNPGFWAKMEEVYG